MQYTISTSDPSIPRVYCDGDSLCIGEHVEISFYDKAYNMIRSLSLKVIGVTRRYDVYPRATEDYGGDQLEAIAHCEVIHDSDVIPTPDAEL